MLEDKIFLMKIFPLVSLIFNMAVIETNYNLTSIMYPREMKYGLPKLYHARKKSWNPWEIETETLIQFYFARNVPVDQQPYALGLQSDIIKLLGTIPGPIVMGALIDNTCILWDKG